ncbi:DsbA family protein [Rhodoferax sp. GW822-FHT02A01]|uniref:2-hydroxychromene-2-carboxylate isomerase n=1 Tax=Rhodoferax sp. GW822-FHT02A01 TaxID=3141537 RepID=UPI00315DAEBF
MEKALWFFDLVSPFSYLHFHKLGPLRDQLQIRAVPVLFAGLLKHWGTKGPAEVPSKRLHTYQYCVWAAGQQGLPFCMPARHPFNPLPALRLLVALGASDESVSSAFHFVYGEGRDPEIELMALGRRLKVTDVQALISSPEVKQQLVGNTQWAIDLGVFGVSTLIVRNKLFWGSDTVEWARHFLNEPDLFDQPAYRRAADAEFGVARS